MAKPPKPSPREPVTAPNVMLPPVDATPEEIARALVRVPRPKRPAVAAEELDDDA